MLRKTPSEFLDALRKELARRQTTNRSYSIRAFARDLGIESSQLSKFLSGKRIPSVATIQALARRIGLDAEFGEGVSLKRRAVSDVKLESASGVPIRWDIEALIVLTETAGFKSSPAWIAKRLSISVAQAEDAIEEALRMKWLRKTPQGALIRSRDRVNYHFSNDHIDWRKYRKELLERAVAWGVPDRPDVRHFSAEEFSFDPNAISRIEKEAMRFNNDIAAIAETSKERTEAYCMVICVFPVSDLAEFERRKKAKPAKKTK